MCQSTCVGYGARPQPANSSLRPPHRQDTLLHRTHTAARAIRRGFAPSSAGTGLRLPLPELPESTVKPLQVRLTQRNTALQCEEREKSLVIGLRPPHFFLELLGSPFTHREFLRSLFPAFFKKPHGSVIRQHVPKKQLEQERTFVGILFNTRRLQPLYHGFCPLGRDLIESLIWPESLRHFTHGDEAVRLQAA